MTTKAPAYCPVPIATTLNTRAPVPAILTANAPTPTPEMCTGGATQVTNTGTSVGTSTSTTVAGPPGPKGDTGPAGCSLGMKVEGAWAVGNVYVKQDCPDHPNASVVTFRNCAFVCIEDNISDNTNQPPDPNSFDVTTGGTYWLLLAGQGPAGTMAPKDKSFFDNMKDGLFDWIDKASVPELLLAGLVAAGVIYAGVKLIEEMSKGSTNAPAAGVYNGDPTWSGTYTYPTLRNVVESLCLEAGDIQYYDVSLLAQTPCAFTVASVTAVRNVLDQLSKAFQFDMVDSAGMLRFVPRNPQAVKTLTVDDFGFVTSGKPQAPVTKKRVQSSELPRDIAFSYISEALDYNKFTQNVSLPQFTEGNSVTLDVPFIMDDDFAKSTADTVLIGAHIERMQYMFNTSYANIELEPGDVIDTPYGFMRVIKITESDSSAGILQFTCTDAGALGPPEAIIENGITVGYTASTYLGTGVSGPTAHPAIGVKPDIGNSGVIFFDPPVMNSSDNEPRCYAAIHGFGAVGWPGAVLFQSTDGGNSYSPIQTIMKESTWGMVTNATTNHDYHSWDNDTTITVTLKTGKLMNATDIAVYNKTNWCMIGQECIGFKYATLVSDKTYTLSGLLRGRQGTEYACSTHVANELFVLLDSAPAIISVPESERGAIHWYKVCTIGADLSAVDGQQVQVLGNNTVPWQVCNPVITNSLNTWTIAWTERPRFINDLKDSADINHDDDFGGYAVIVYGPDGTTIKRNELVFAPTWSYTPQMQLDDFANIQSHLKIKVALLSKKFGSGVALSINN